MIKAIAGVVLLCIGLAPVAVSAVQKFGWLGALMHLAIAAGATALVVVGLRLIIRDLD